jgi:lipopolysaccharide export system permease protein
MLIIKRYIAKEFVSYLLICSLSLIIIAIVFSTLAELPNLEKENGTELFLKAILSGIPLLIEVIVPISVLLATVLAFISLSKSSEIIAMMAAGVSLFHLVLPVFFCGIVIAGLLYLNQSFLAPYWGADERAGLVTTRSNTDIWRFHHNTIYYFSSPDKSNRTVAFGRSFTFDEQHRVIETSQIAHITGQQSGWEIKRQKTITIRDEGITQQTRSDLYTPAAEFPIVFTKDLVNPKYSSFSELADEIAVKTKSAVNYKTDLFALYQKVAGTLSIFVMILLALPFSIYSGRAANVRTGIVISVVLGFVFWLVDQILLSFNNTDLVPMWVSAFGANFLFFMLALVLIRLKRS